MPSEQEEACVIIQVIDDGAHTKLVAIEVMGTGQIFGCFDGRICYWIGFGRGVKFPEQLSCVLVTLVLLSKVGHDDLERSNDFLKVTHLE